MKVSELIAALQQQDPNARVIVNGYEGGYSDVSSTQVLDIATNFHDDEEWWYGPHELASYWQVEEKEKTEGKTLYNRETAVWIG